MSNTFCVKQNIDFLVFLFVDFLCLMPLSVIFQLYKCIMATSFSGRRSQSTQREPLTMGQNSVSTLTFNIQNVHSFNFSLVDMLWLYHVSLGIALYFDTEHTQNKCFNIIWPSGDKGEASIINHGLLMMIESVVLQT